MTHIRDQGLGTQQYIKLRRSHGQVTKVPRQTPHITTEYSADSRNRTPRARICLHTQKPKPQACIKEKINYTIYRVTCLTTIQKKTGTTPQGSRDDNVTATINKTHNPALQHGFSWGGKKEEYAKPRTYVRAVSYGKIGLTTISETHDLLSEILLVLYKEKTHPPM